MHKITLAISHFVLVFLFTSCSNDSNPADSSPDGCEHDESYFPLRVGNSWTYEWKSELGSPYGISSDSGTAVLSIIKVDSNVYTNYSGKIYTLVLIRTGLKGPSAKGDTIYLTSDRGELQRFDTLGGRYYFCIFDNCGRTRPGVTLLHGHKAAYSNVDPFKIHTDTAVTVPFGTFAHCRAIVCEDFASGWITEHWMVHEIYDRTRGLVECSWHRETSFPVYNVESFRLLSYTIN